MRLVATTALLTALASTVPAAAFRWPNATDRVERGLASTETTTRRGAAALIVELPEAPARRLAERALADPDEEVRLSAASAALAVGVARAGEIVAPWLSDPDRRLRLAATEVLQAHPSDAAIPALGRTLGDADEEIRASAAEALGRSGSAQAVMPLLGHLDDGAPAVRLAVVRAVARLSDPRAIIPLIGRVQDPRESVRRAVVHALGELRDGRAESAVVLALADADADVRVAALGALGKLRASSTIASIVSLLASEPQPDVRAAALGALGRIGTDRAIEIVVSALDAEQAADRAAAHDVVVRTGSVASQHLERCLETRGSPRRAAGCAAALAVLGVGVSPDVLIGALRRGVLGPRAALGALGALGSSGGLATVLEHLTDADPTVRAAAIDAAAALLDPAAPDGRAVEPIARALELARSGRDERRALVVLLGRTGSPRAKDHVLPFATSEHDVELRLAALEALGRLGPAGQDGALVSALDDERAPVRLAAALALRRSAAGASAVVLLDRLDRTAQQDRAAVLLALGGAMERSGDATVLRRALRRLEVTRGPERDALIEAIGRMPQAAMALDALARGAATVPDRVKIAEALSAHSTAEASLAALALDPDGAVRANAVWGLGAVGTKRSAALLAEAIGDRDVAVAANAAAAYGRLGVRDPTVAAHERLCRAVGESRAVVRAAALVAVRHLEKRCGDGAVERLLVSSDRAERVRRAAAELLAAVPSGEPAADARALEQCAEEDPSGLVAVACVERPAPRAAGAEAVTVYVVPPGDSSPRGSAPFTLVFADGASRHGITDRRGAVLEAAAPRGVVRLDVAAPLRR